ncbi:MAG TPA: T9SS type A sorting domain-containing protein [Bacteroidota bacterium]|nr:T9SS type A sorting domain-containing protein [Bacteroidota bacterium]
MKSRMLLCLLFAFVMTGYAGIGQHLVPYKPAKIEAAGDTVYVPGGTLALGENAGSLETAINSDTLAGGVRKNPNRVYALYQGQYYFQLAPIYCNNPTGTLTICGVPSASGTTKPIIIITPVSPSTQEGTNTVYGSIKCDGIHYQAQQVTGTFNAELFYCGTANKAKQRLTINNCLFEFSNIDLFDCTNETGAIGGWPNGASFFITNSYFRNMFYSGQWWGSRVFQCKHPIDTLWVENCTVTTGGLTFLQQNELTDFEYINHNTIVNNKKYWLLSPYHRIWLCTNNIFMNQNWVGEDTNVTNSGQDPDKYFMSTINVDTNNATNGLTTQSKYWNGDSAHFVAALGFAHMRVYIADNVNYYNPILSTGYYNNSKYVTTPPGSIPSSLNWAGAGTGPWKIGNTPGMWMNSRTTALFAAWGPPTGGFIEKRTTTANPNTQTVDIVNAAEVDSMAQWNQNQWGDSRFTHITALTATPYIYGDYDPTTLPGISGGHKTDTMTVGKAGITKFTDLTENFSQSTVLSGIDGLPVGALIWDDTKLAAFNSATDFNAVVSKYMADGGPTLAVAPTTSAPATYALSQNYPNPFNPTTTIEFTMPKASQVDLKVYNVLGQLVATLVHDQLPAGQHAYTFNATNLASGTYFFRLTAGDFSSVKKMLLLK